MNNTRVIIADKYELNRKHLRELLKRAGYLVVAEAADVNTALQLLSKTEPDLILLDVELKGFDNLQVLRVMEERRMIPLILTMNYDYKLMMEMVSAGGVFGILVKPIQESALVPTVESAIANFKHMKKLERENGKLSKELETRKLVERAKGILMEKEGMTEPEAYRYLQKLSMDQCTSISKIARKIIKSN